MWVKATDAQLWACKLVPKFCTLYVLQLRDGYMVRVNGTEVQRTIESLEQAQEIAVKAAKKLNSMLTEALN